jgi:hypothetical protein
VSALSHYLEAQGVPTVAISLIRLHSEKIQNPRSLWVPFELGRPLGPPRDEAFQVKVITAALRMLASGPGPVMLEDFPEDDPTAVDLPDWKPPFELAARATDLPEPGALESLLRQEAAIIAPFYERFTASNRRTTVGLSGLPIEDALSYMARCLSAIPDSGPIAGVPAVQALRWAIDDVKAFTLEAMSVGAAIPSSRQMQAWFWDRTLAARTIIALRTKLLASDDKRSQAIGRMNLVPGAQVQRLGLQ